MCRARSTKGDICASFALAVALLEWCAPRAVPAQLLPQLERVSVDSLGVEGNGHSRSPSLSFDGRFVAFSSRATNFAPGDSNDRFDVFVRDRLAGTVERVSVDSFGNEANDDSSQPKLSADGRIVAFPSWASNLIPGDANGFEDVFVHDRELHTTERVSSAVGGGDPNDISSEVVISADGRFVAFQSYASNLVPGDGNETSDVFVHDRVSGLTERVTFALDGGDADGSSSGPSISGDGRYVAFTSSASNLTEEDDVIRTGGVFVFDRATRTTRRVTTRVDGTFAESPSGAAKLSADGRWIAFQTLDVGLVSEPDLDFALDVFLFGLDSGERILITASDDRRRQSRAYDISADGRIVTFVSDSRTLLAGNGFKRGDIYVFDRISGALTRANRTAAAAANHCSNDPALSGDGHLVAFQSTATNLVPDDGNQEADVFVGLAGFTCRDDADCRTNAFCEAEQIGECDVLASSCAFAHKPDGTACEDENPCTLAESCQAGRCRPQGNVECPAMDSCHAAGTCDPFAGGACTNPQLPEGTPCDHDSGGVSCSVGAACDDGGECQLLLGTEDPDDDLVCSRDDDCPEVPDPLQLDLDADGSGNACDAHDADIRIERARLRWNGRTAAANGSVRIRGVLKMPAESAPLPANEPIVARFSDGVHTVQSVEFAAGECQSRRAGAIRCRRAGLVSARLAVDLLDGGPGSRRYRLDLVARGLDLPGPFQPPLTLEVISSPPIRGIGVDRVGVALDCRSGARGLHCVAR